MSKPENLQIQKTLIVAQWTAQWLLVLWFCLKAVHEIVFIPYFWQISLAMWGFAGFVLAAKHGYRWWIFRQEKKGLPF